MGDLIRVGALGGSRALAACIGFLAVWQLAARLGPEALGIWSMGLASLGFALHVSEFGLRSVITAEAGVQIRVWRSLLQRYLVLRFIIAVVVAVTTIAMTAFVWPGQLSLMACLLLSVFAIALHLDWIALVCDRPLAAGGCLIVKPLTFSLVIWALPSINTPQDVALALAAGWWISAIVSWKLVSWVDRVGPEPSSIGELLRLGLPLMGNTFINQLQLSLDLLLVGLFAGAAAAGHYYLAAAIVAAGLVFANATGQIATARMARFRDDHRSFAQELRRQLCLTVLLALGLASCLVLIAPMLIPSLFGADFAVTSDMIVYFLPWFVLAGISTHLQGALTAHCQQLLITKSNLALLASLVPALGIAWIWGEPTGFALARAVGEGSRIAVLIAGSGVLAVQMPNNTRLKVLPPKATETMSASRERLRWRGKWV